MLYGVGNIILENEELNTLLVGCVSELTFSESNQNKKFRGYRDTGVSQVIGAKICELTYTIDLIWESPTWDVIKHAFGQLTSLETVSPVFSGSFILDSSLTEVIPAGRVIENLVNTRNCKVLTGFTFTGGTLDLNGLEVQEGDLIEYCYVADVSPEVEVLGNVSLERHGALDVISITGVLNTTKGDYILEAPFAYRTSNPEFIFDGGVAKVRISYELGLGYDESELRKPFKIYSLDTVTSEVLLGPCYGILRDVTVDYSYEDLFSGPVLDSGTFTLSGVILDVFIVSGTEGVDTIVIKSEDPAGNLTFTDVIARPQSDGLTLLDVIIERSDGETDECTLHLENGNPGGA